MAPRFAEPPFNETIESHGKRVDNLRSKAGRPSFVHGSIIAHAAEDARQNSAMPTDIRPDFDPRA